MPIQPKFRFDSPPDSAQRYFTDRDEPRAIFAKYLNANSTEEHQILNFYGIGGVGKSRLITEFVNSVKKSDRWTPLTLDMAQANLHESAAALLNLRNQLAKALPKFKFRSFDYVYATYWQKLNPSIDLSDSSFDILENSDLLTEIGTNLFDTLEAVPGLGIINKVAKLGKKANSAINSWWLKRGCSITQQLEQKQSNEIKLWLPAYFAQDIHDFLDEYPQHRVCVFFDTYEALWENNTSAGKFFEVDEWVRELVGHLPQFLFVIAGREKLRWLETDPDWNDVIDSHILERLSDKDSTLFLERCGIANNTIASAIAISSEGSPFYLDLAVDSYRKLLSSGKSPDITDFMGKTPRELLDRFIRYLDRNELASLKVLALCRTYDVDLFSALMKAFETGYSPVNFAEFNRYSFIHHINEHDFTISALMKRAMIDYLEKDTQIRVRSFLYHYFRDKITDLALEGAKGFSNFDNVSYYATDLVFNNEKRFDYLMLCGRVYQYQTKMADALAQYEKAVSVADSNLIEVQQARIEIATTQRQHGDEVAASRTIKKILEDCIVEPSDEIKGKALVQLGLCYYSLAQTKHEPALIEKCIECYQEGLELALKLEDAKQIVYTKLSLSTAFESIGKIPEAIELLHECKVLAKKNGFEHQYIDCLNGLARKYIIIGEYTTAIELAEEGLKRWQQSNFKRGQLVMCCHLLEAHFKLGNPKESVTEILTDGQTLSEDVTETLIIQMFEKSKSLWL
ncbi:hypothetical protein SAMN06297280_3142 [Arsukibacterium tuosuense]|uniref:Orc1-like AAA ATPase domain-containing protein n=1 Tax=Arsukibacterium tuosuense TaxID=1323745 RepID=A0A285JAB3_9GAMM|nr:hypothetical protein [Arsukibacterium tuosuense]SNY56817.1 hypothetical protein SAMN06297280_3142 [Arsukibacterium tuosuense]